MGTERVKREQTEPDRRSPSGDDDQHRVIRRKVPPTKVVRAQLVVGASSDPAEREADRTAATVLDRLHNWASEQLGDGRGTSTTTMFTGGLGDGPGRIRRSIGAGETVSTDGPWIGPTGGALDDGTATRIQRRRGGGRPLDAGVRRSMERAFGTGFAGVRIHDDAEAHGLSQRIQARAFTTGSDIFFRSGDYDTSTATGQQLIAHELAHVVQQGGGVARAALCEYTNIIHRHASWEHKMLGDVDPATLEIIAAGRDVAAEQAKLASTDAATRADAKTIQNEAGVTIGLDTVLHTIDQEVRRLKLFQTNPPTGTVAKATKRLEQRDATDRKAEIGEDVVGHARQQAQREINNTKWGVRLVSLDLEDGSSFLVTYGEMNTLADFYGSAAEIAQTPADNFRSIVGGVREESIRKYMRLRNELAVGQPQKYAPDDAAHNVPGAIGNKGSLVGANITSPFINADQFGELKLMGKAQGILGNEKRAEIGGREETSYTAGLGRNACHFAPHSWHSWATAHDKAVTLAQQSCHAKDQADQLKQQTDILLQHDPLDPTAATNKRQINVLRANAAEKLNTALIENGFGDHFLQDSYAAGHLINKTLIMQWFVKWLDTKGFKRDYTYADDWRQVQQIAYGQSDVAGSNLFDPTTIGQAASNDPQSVENLGGTWIDRFNALGLRIPSVLRDPNTRAFEIFTWWQEQAMLGKHLSSDWKDLQKEGPIKDKTTLQNALFDLIDAGVVYFARYSQSDRAQGARGVGLENFLYSKSLSIKREYIPKADKQNEFRQAKQQALAGNPAAYQRMAKAVTYADYHRFLNHGYVQLATNVLHDHFCKNGLAVATGANDTPYRIYGDNAMLGKESSKMVKYSAETSHRSRDAIYQIAETGAADADHTTAAIAARFPTWVRPVGLAQNLSLDQWHGDGGVLHRFCNDTIFAEVTAVNSKSTVAADATLASKISKDVHAGAAF